MNYLVFSDLHLSEKTLDMVTKVFDQMAEYSQQNKINNWLFGGDWFHQQEGEAYEIILKSICLIEKLKEKDIMIHAIKGNHDKHSWKLLGFMGLSLIPNGYSISSDFTFELCHYVPSECSVYFGDKNKPLKSFNKSKLYFLGHWHQPNMFQKNNLYFLGSLVPDKYGLLNEVYRCGFVHFNSENLEVKWVQSNVEGKFTMNADKWLEFLKQRLVKTTDFVKVICRNKTEIEIVEAKIKEFNIQNTRIIPIFDKPKKSVNKKQNIPSLEQIIEGFGKENELDTRIPLETLNKLGRKLGE